ncbi:hypothetical protein [Rhodovarius lipocyclicus]|uniref:hypothetical protein n=1 Tax=Rhodovarius lipocyclicus TaxID=268410 RepID=UPI0013572266|nr:hypothetical protein [Rhodovarius lipocyclicus]
MTGQPDAERVPWWGARLYRRWHDWREWKRRDREEIFVASAEFSTVWTESGEKTGDITTYIVSFFIDGNGTRWSTVDREGTHRGEFGEERHIHMRQCRHEWREFGDLPSWARRPASTPKGKLVLIKGGLNDRPV